MYDPALNEFKLGHPTCLYRVAVQALDLMSLHIDVHVYHRPRLVLALLALVLMQEMGLINMYEYFGHTDFLKQSISTWILIQRESPSDFTLLYQKFLELYCKEMLPENFDCRLWPTLL